MYITPAKIREDIGSLYPMLFGSRCMAMRAAVDGFDPALMIGAQITQHTDWDYSISYSDKHCEHLLSAGYTLYSGGQLSPYADSLTQAVAIKEYLDADSLFPIHTVNVVLHSDEALFRQVWRSIDAEFYYQHLWKRSPYYDGLDDSGEIKTTIKGIMNQLYSTAREMI